jgi:hypothetical protein
MATRSQTRFAVVFASAVLTFVAHAIGQTPPVAQARPPQGTGLVMGQVVDAITGKPVAGVTVSIGGGPNATFAYSMGPGGEQIAQGPGRPAAPPGAPRLVLTDGEGRFVFHDLLKGNYVVRTTMTGYVWGGYGQHRPNGPVQPLTLASDDSKIGDLTIRIFKTGVLTGMVLDEAGEPMVGAQVHALRRTLVNGGVRLLSIRNEMTDDHGVYRLATLDPSDYIVAVISSVMVVPGSTATAFEQALGSGSSLSTSEVYRQLTSSGLQIPVSIGYRVGDLIVSTAPSLGRPNGGLISPSPGNDQKLWFYPTTFYPSATTSAQASIVRIDSGEERAGIDLRLSLAPTVRISGTVTGPAGPMPNTGVRLLPADALIVQANSALETNVTTTDDSGAFTFLGVTPGQYVLKVLRVPMPPPSTSPPSNMTIIEISGPGGQMGIGMSRAAPVNVLQAPPPLPTEPTLWATMPLSVADADITGVSITLRQGLRLSGRLQFDGSRPPPTAAQLQRASIQITPLEARTFFLAPQSRVDPEGQFVAIGFDPGLYQISAALNLPAQPQGGSGWTLKSVTVGGRSLADDPLEVGDRDISDIVIAFTDRANQITGTVINERGQPDASAEVVLFPADGQAWRKSIPNTRRIRGARTSPTGVYEFSGLQVGEYFVIAVNGTSSMNLQDPKFLEALIPMATRVIVTDGDKKTQELTTKQLAAAAK